MIAVVGSPLFTSSVALPGGGATGRAAQVAFAAAAAGSPVELVARVGEDPAGDAVMLSLARGGVGHLAVLRDARPTPAVPDAPAAPNDGDEDPAVALIADAAADDSPATSLEGLPLDAADVTLGLRYLGDFRVVVAAEPVDDATAAALVEAAAFLDAVVVAVISPRAGAAAAFAQATVLEAPPDDPDNAFAGLVGRFAAALDRGVQSAVAFREATQVGGWQAAPADDEIRA